MPGFSKLFKNFRPFGKMMQNKIAKGFNLNSLKHVNAVSMGKNSKKGMVSVGINSKAQLKEKLLGVNVGVVDPNFQSVGMGAGHTSSKLGATIGRKITNLTTRNYAGQILVGSTAMASVAIMNGAMNQAQDIMYNRYMNDARYSSRLMSRTRIGQASGNSSLSPSSTAGLSLAMSKVRHGY